jgi:hypothetical protein
MLYCSRLFHSNLNHYVYRMVDQLMKNNENKRKCDRSQLGTRINLDSHEAQLAEKEELEIECNYMVSQKKIESYKRHLFETFIKLLFNCINQIAQSFFLYRMTLLL